ncbi:MAG TPA: hypothetical protein VJ992_07960 [Gemmatimonadales bacterium]|nr:hypothetical protein [Gemmatimonadales bacterium]
MRWFLIEESTGRRGAENMWVDDALLRRAAEEGVGFLRLYRWTPGCLSFGRNEPATRRYDRAAITARGLDTVRRPTGGRAVWHDTEVTYAVAAPTAWFGTLAATYRAIHETIARAVRALGATAELAAAPARGTSPSPGAGACFASPAGGEVTVDGRKLVGSAQVREGTAFLQHGSILLADAQDVVAAVTRGAAPPPSATSLTAALGRPVTFAELGTVLRRAARSDWGGTWATADAPAPATDAPNRYADDTWTWRR